MYYVVSLLMEAIYIVIYVSEIDECQRLLDNCQQECINTEGSFNCSCNEGFELQDDEHTCEGNKLYQLLCDSLFIIVDLDSECLDSDMCEQFCVRNNITGTENCSCQSGFVLATNLVNCTGKMASLFSNEMVYFFIIDIDECSLTNPCTQYCNNTIGSFECSCRDGFQLHSDKFTCTGTVL